MEKPNFPLGEKRVPASLLMPEENLKKYGSITRAAVVVLYARTQNAGNVLSVADAMDFAWRYIEPQTELEIMQLGFFVGLYYAEMATSMDGQFVYANLVMGTKARLLTNVPFKGQQVNEVSVNMEELDFIDVYSVEFEQAAIQLQSEMMTNHVAEGEKLLSSILTDLGAETE